MIGCPHCGQGLPVGQEPLTDKEIARLPMGNQNTKWNVIRWRVVKATAAYHNVSDWTATVDPELSYEENLRLMAQHGTDPRVDQQTMKELTSEL